MAYLIVTTDPGKIYWEIVDLASPFTSAHYTCAGICAGDFENGTRTPPEAIYQSKTPNSTPPEDPRYISGEVSVPGGVTYYVRGFAQDTRAEGNSPGQYWVVETENGESSTTIYVPPVSGGGGGDGQSIAQWSWDINTDRQAAKAMLEGQIPAVRFKASVWNDLVQKIAELNKRWRDWYYPEYNDPVWWTSSTARDMGIDSYGINLSQGECRVQSGQSLSAEGFNSVCLNTCIYCDYGSLPSFDMEPEDEIHGDYILALVDDLNKGIIHYNNFMGY